MVLYPLWQIAMPCGALVKIRWENCVAEAQYLGARPGPALGINLTFETQFLACPLSAIRG